MKPVAWRYENKNVKGIRERDIAQDQVEVFREALMAIKYDFHTLVRAGALRLNGAGKIPVAEVDRLIEARGIAPEVAQRAALAKAVGFNDWTSPTVAAGERMHGGPACAFIVRTLNPGHVMAVDLRYFDAELNGGKLLPGRTVTETTGHGKRTVSMLLNGATITRHKAS